MGQRNIPMRLFALVTAALALDYDAERKKKKDKLESYDCEGTAIADAITSVTNVEVFGCIDFETGDKDGDAPAEALAMKKPPEGVAARCLFKCAEGFEEAYHRNEFFVIDLAVTINICFSNHFIDLLVRELLPEVCHHCKKLGEINRAISIGIDFVYH